MISFKFKPTHSRLLPALEARVKNCIVSLVTSRLTGLKCPKHCETCDIEVEISGKWADGDFVAHVTSGCCAAYVMHANARLSGAAMERRARGSSGFLVA